MLITEKWQVKTFVTMIIHVGDVFLSISGQKYAEFGIELGLANVLDNFSFSFVFSIKNEGVIEVFSKNNIKDVT